MPNIYLWRGKPLLIDGKLAISQACCCDDCELECCCDCFFPVTNIPYPEDLISGEGVPPPCDGFLNCEDDNDPRNFYCASQTEIVNYFSNWWYSEADPSSTPTNTEYQLISVNYQTGVSCSLVSICADDTNRQWVLQHLCEFIVPICGEQYERGFCYEDKSCDPEVDPDDCCEAGALISRTSSAFTTVYALNTIRDQDYGNGPVDEYAGSECSFTSQIGQVGWFGFYHFDFPGCAGCRREWWNFITGSTPTFANLKIEQGACLVGASPCDYPIAEGADGDWDEDGYIEPVEEAPTQQDLDCYSDESSGSDYPPSGNVCGGNHTGLRITITGALDQTDDGCGGSSCVRTHSDINTTYDFTADLADDSDTDYQSYELMYFDGTSCGGSQCSTEHGIFICVEFTCNEGELVAVWSVHDITASGSICGASPTYSGLLRANGTGEQTINTVNWSGRCRNPLFTCGLSTQNGLTVQAEYI